MLQDRNNLRGKGLELNCVVDNTFLLHMLLATSCFLNKNIQASKLLQQNFRLDSNCQLDMPMQLHFLLDKRNLQDTFDRQMARLLQRWLKTCQQGKPLELPYLLHSKILQDTLSRPNCLQNRTILLGNLLELN